jgi:hypothetical protein
MFLKSLTRILTKKRIVPPLPAALLFGIAFASLMGAGALRGANQPVNPVFSIAGVVLLLLGGWALGHNGKNKALLLKEKLDLKVPRVLSR